MQTAATVEGILPAAAGQGRTHVWSSTTAIGTMDNQCVCLPCCSLSQSTNNNEVYIVRDRGAHIQEICKIMALYSYSVWWSFYGPSPALTIYTYFKPE
jgi:hypothetical protein